MEKERQLDLFGAAPADDGKLQVDSLPEPRIVPVGGKPPEDLSHRHHAIMDWMLLNPDKKLRDCALALGYTQAWLSTVINGDAFQAEFAKRRKEIDHVIAHDIPSKMRVLADIALEKLTDEVEKTTNAGFVFETADMILGRLGYAPQKNSAPAAPAVQNNVQFVLGKDMLADLRERIVRDEGEGVLQPSRPVPPSADSQGEPPRLPAP